MLNCASEDRGDEVSCAALNDQDNSYQIADDDSVLSTKKSFNAGGGASSRMSVPLSIVEQVQQEFDDFEALDEEEILGDDL